MIVYMSGNDTTVPKGQATHKTIMLSFDLQAKGQTEKFRTLLSERESNRMDVASHFLDSGAFSLTKVAAKYHKQQGGDPWDFYNSPEFWEYLEAYASFIKKYRIGIDFYANLDVIGNPALTWRNQQALEKRGLRPVPVVHYRTDPDLKWLKHYVRKGYKYIGFGGLVGRASTAHCKNWLHTCFSYLCDTPDRTPRIKVHGFGVMWPSLLQTFPWYSVDATNAEKLARYGEIIVPRTTKGQWDYLKQAYIIAVSPRNKEYRPNLNLMCGLRKQVVYSWLSHVNTSGVFSKPLAFDVNDDLKALNAYYYVELMKTRGPWPHTYLPKRRKSHASLFLRG